MILWTIQSIEAWNTLQAFGVLRAKREYAEGEFIPAYEWIAEQMEKRLGAQRPFPGALPIWAWYQWDGEKRKRPDLRSRSFLSSGEKGVRIEFEIPAEHVLLSDFNLWHYVLNYWYLGSSSADCETFEKDLAKRELSFYETKPLPNLELDREIRESWERIFDLEWEEPDMTFVQEDKSIQATLWELRVENIKRADEFRAR